MNNKCIGALARLLVPAFIAVGTIATPAMAQDKKAEAGKVTVKEIAKNDQLRAYEAIFKPGDEAANVERPARVVRALTAGTLERTYQDGKKDRVEFKEGEVKIYDKSAAYAPKNVGTTTLHLFIVSSQK